MVNQGPDWAKLKPILAAILLGQNEPLAPHHIGALNELLGYPTQEELPFMVRGLGAALEPNSDEKMKEI